MPESINSQSFMKNFLSGLLGVGGIRLGQKALRLLTVVLLTRMLSTDDYGYYIYALSVVGILAVPGKLGLPQLVIRELANAEARSQWALMRGLRRWAYQVSAFSSIIVMLVPGCILLFYANRIESLDQLTFAVALFLLPILVAIALLGSMLRGLRFVVQAAWPDSILTPVLTLFSLGLIAIAGFGLQPEEAMVVTLISSTIAMTVLIKLIKEKWPTEAQSAPIERQQQAWNRSLLPFTLLGGVNVVANKTDILMLGLLASPADVGIYNVITRMGELVGFSLIVFASYLAPNIARLYSKSDLKSLQRLITISNLLIVSLSGTLFIIFIAFGEWMLSHVFGAEYGKGYWPLVIICTGQFFCALTGFVGLLLSMTGHEKDTLRAAVFTAVINVVLNLLLIPSYGIIGAATATATSLILYNIVMGIMVYRRLQIFPGPIAGKVW